MPFYLNKYNNNNLSQILVFIFKNISECDKFQNFKSFDKLFIYLRFYVLESVKEVVVSRVEKRVRNLIACYSFDFSQINVIFVFFLFKYV